MTKLNKVGFFQELPHGDTDGPILKDLIRKEANKQQNEIIQYLVSGVELITCLGVTSDILDPSSDVIISPNIITDGTWAWPLDLSYYVKAYNIELPKEFTKHIENNNWEIPIITDEILFTLEI